MSRELGDYDSVYLAKQKPARLGLKLLGVFLAVAVTITGVGFALGWMRAGVAVISPDNVKAQWQFAYDYDASLKAIAGNWCTAKSAEDAAVGDAKLQRQSQRIAIEQNYRRVEAQYDARLADAFRAKLVRPSDVPSRAPGLAEATASC